MKKSKYTIWKQKINRYGKFSYEKVGSMDLTPTDARMLRRGYKMTGLPYCIFKD